MATLEWAPSVPRGAEDFAVAVEESKLPANLQTSDAFLSLKMKSQYYFAAMLLPLSIAETCVAQYEKEISDLLQRVEFKAPEWEQLNKLGKHSVVSLTLLLEQGDSGLDVPRAIAIMGRQYKLYEKELSESERQRALEMMVAKSRTLTDTPLLMALNSFKGIESEEIRKLALDHQNDQDELIRTVANSLLISETKQSSTQVAARLKGSPFDESLSESARFQLLKTLAGSNDESAIKALIAHIDIPFLGPEKQNLSTVITSPDWEVFPCMQILKKKGEAIVPMIMHEVAHPSPPMSAWYKEEGAKQRMLLRVLRSLLGAVRTKALVRGMEAGPGKASTVAIWESMNPTGE
jgi:hypothetical protein